MSDYLYVYVKKQDVVIECSFRSENIQLLQNNQKYEV
jgi:hypothetical protein